MLGAHPSTAVAASSTASTALINAARWLARSSNLNEPLAFVAKTKRRVKPAMKQTDAERDHQLYARHASGLLCNKVL